MSLIRMWGQRQLAADAGGHHLLALPHQPEDHVAVELGEVGGAGDQLFHDFQLVLPGKRHHGIFADELYEVEFHVLSPL